MAGFDYNPERRIVLGDEVDRYAELVDEVGDLSGDTDFAAVDGLPENPANTPETIHKWLGWLVNGDDDFSGYGEDAEVVIRGLDTGAKNAVTRHVQTRRMGEVGTDDLQTHLAAVCVVEAPWLDETYEAAEDIAHRVEVMEEAPGPVTDWIVTERRRLQQVEVGNGN